LSSLSSTIRTVLAIRPSNLQQTSPHVQHTGCLAGHLKTEFKLAPDSF
jgi:hypothetical protein